MNVEEKLQKMLTDRGMSDCQANEVMELAIPELNNLVEGYSITMDRPSDEYPNVIYNVLFMQIKPVALKWINENKPMAWFKNMFE
jgi:hypothetical protein